MVAVSVNIFLNFLLFRNPTALHMCVTYPSQHHIYPRHMDLLYLSQGEAEIGVALWSTTTTTIVYCMCRHLIYVTFE